MCKKSIYLVCFVLLLSLAGNALADLVVHWRLDEGSGTTAYDSSGSVNNGTFNGGPVWQPTSGQIDGALEFEMKYVYLLQSIPFPDQRYIGMTDKLKNRLENHNSGG